MESGPHKESLAKDSQRLNAHLLQLSSPELREILKQIGEKGPKSLSRAQLITRPGLVWFFAASNLARFLTQAPWHKADEASCHQED